MGGVLIRTEDHPPQARLDFLHHMVAETIVPFAVSVADGHDVRVHILTGPVGMLDVAKIDGPPMSAVRTPKLIRVSDPEMVKVDVQLRGRTVMAQGGREAAMTTGDFTMVDLSRPCQVHRADEHEVVAVKFRRALLPLRHDELARLTAVPVSGRDGLGATISAVARHLAGHLAGGGPAEGTRIAAALVDLLVAELAERLDRSATLAPDTRRRALLAQVQTFINQRLRDPTLSPSMIAAAHHISTRLLHMLFQGCGATVGEWIRQRRLERCRGDLLNPQLADHPVSAIGARWGFHDPAHFSRAFRTAYGRPPGEYRKAASSTADAPSVGSSGNCVGLG